MLIDWKINRYSRCYEDVAKQCLDSDRKASIFQYFSHLETQKATQVLGTYWSSVNSSSNWSISVQFGTPFNKQCELAVVLIEPKSGNRVVLVGIVRDISLICFQLLFIGEFNFSKRLCFTIQSVR